MITNNDINKKGERFVLNKLQTLGWNVDYSNCEYFSFILKKEDKQIKIQIQTSLKGYLKEIENFDFDYLIITNLADCWVIPKLVYKKTHRLIKTFNLLGNKWGLLEFVGYNLVNEVNDCKIPYYLMNKAVLHQISQEMTVRGGLNSKTSREIKV